MPEREDVACVGGMGERVMELWRVEDTEGALEGGRDVCMDVCMEGGRNEHKNAAQSIQREGRGCNGRA